MRQGVSAGDITNKRNCRTVFADYVRQRSAAQLGLRTPIRIQAFNGGTNPALAYQTAVEGAQYTVSSEYDSYIAEVSNSFQTIAITTVPGAPTSIAGISGDQSVTVSFVVPADDGGSAITSYTVTVSPGGQTETGASSPIVVSGLTNGTTYTFTVYATNAIGNSPQSLASLAVTPVGLPGTISGGSAISGDGQITVTFTGVDDGGSSITNYLYRLDYGAFIPFSPAVTTSPLVITGLTNGVSYRVGIKAVNAVGESLSAIDLAPVTPYSAPNAPTLVNALADDSAAYIYFTSPGSIPVTGYTYSIDGGATFVSATGTISPIKIIGLTNGQLYNVQVRAVNSSGSSTASIISVTPVAASVASPLLYYDPSNSSSYSGAGSTVTSIGSGTATGTKAAAVTYNAAVKGGVFDFPGTSGAVITFPSFNFGNTISVAAWIYPRSQANINGLFTNAGANVPTNGFKFQWNWWPTSSRVISFQAGNGTTGGDVSTPQNIITYDTWQHFGYVFDKTNQKTIFFLNGVPAAQVDGVATVANINTNAAFNVGGYVGGSYTMNAQLGYIKIFNSLLDASQMYADYNSSKSRFI